MRQFAHRSQQWEAEIAGGSHGLGTATTKWGIEFRCLSDTTLGPYIGHISHNDLTQISEEQLRVELDTAIAEETSEDEQ